MTTTPAQRLLHQWAPAMLPVGLLLLITAAILATVLPRWWVLVWLQLPLYMLHQYEEHDGGRFGRWVNTRLGRDGRDVLTPTDIVVINLPLVWGVITASAALALWVRPGLGLIAPYLTLFNALIHLGPALAMRAYNPGLVTAVALFLPGGGAAIVALQQTGDATLAMHALALATTVFLHGLIVVKVLATRRALAAPPALAFAAIVALLPACIAPPRAADLTPDQAWAITQAAYQRGCDDGTFFNAGERGGTTLGDVGGLEGDAWRLGFDDVLNGRPQRTDAQLRAWLARQSPYPSAP